MKRLLFLAFIVALVSARPLQSQSKQQTFDVHQPTILAFFPPVTQAELSKDADTNAALDDFQFYAGKVGQTLASRGIDFQQVYARSFSIRTGKSLTTFKPTKVQVGYYLISPGKEPRVEYGVLTDADLMKVADEYFDAAPPAQKTEPIRLFVEPLGANIKTSIQPPVTVEGGYPVLPPRPVSTPDPKMPEGGLKGTVLIECIVDTDGRVQEPRITQSLSPKNDSTALLTVKHWKFLPTERDGKPVAVRTTIGVVF